jgi:hypothetical protein
MFSSGNGTSTRDCTVGDDRFGDLFGFRQRQEEGGRFTAWNSGEGEMFAVGRSLETRDHLGDVIEIRQIERRVGAERQPDTSDLR